jgi:hypothetical protein
VYIPLSESVFGKIIPIALSTIRGILALVAEKLTEFLLFLQEPSC